MIRTVSSAGRAFCGGAAEQDIELPAALAAPVHIPVGDIGLDIAGPETPFPPVAAAVREQRLELQWDGLALSVAVRPDKAAVSTEGAAQM
ncbi:MAG: hypothetical protein ABSE73_22475 [Planctomycetota bacterium]